MPPVGCQLSTLKKAEERDERILRLFNLSDSQSSDATVASRRAIQACTQTRLDEQPVKSVVKSATTSARFYRDKRGHLATRLCE
ncbi:glycosyl hydrolase-related protein [Citrobacter sp. ANG330]|uniref:glycosyl hydrolase-related protein n=1 Tax=Citrobacter sp. ANG330 TaxID=3048142 RepID=UPI0039C3F553